MVMAWLTEQSVMAATSMIRFNQRMLDPSEVLARLRSCQNEEPVGNLGE
jgi:hypothetical protein